MAFIVCLATCATQPTVLLTGGLLPTVEVPQGQTGAVRAAAEAAVEAALPLYGASVCEAASALRGYAR